jgi:O-antigen/teichoic acid export membrane protein
VLSGFVFFGRPFIVLWGGPDYAGSFYVALLLMVPVTALLIQNLGVEIQKAKNLHQFRSLVSLGVAIGNVLLSIPLTQRYQGLGAAAGTAMSLIIGNVIIMNWYYQARVGLDIRVFWGQMFILSRGMVPALAAGVAIGNLIDISRIELLLLFGALYVAIYAAGVWWLGMNDYERLLIKSLVLRLVPRRGEK